MISLNIYKKSYYKLKFTKNSMFHDVRIATNCLGLLIREKN